MFADFVFHDCHHSRRASTLTAIRRHDEQETLLICTELINATKCHTLP